MHFKKSISILSMSAILATSLALATVAEAKKRDRSYNTANHISWSALVNKLETQGYQIREIDMKRNGWKAKAIQGGKIYELRLDASGTVLRKKRDY